VIVLRGSEVESVVTLELGDVPPSLNRVGSRGSHWAYDDKKRQWQTDLGLLLMAAKLPRGLERVEASASLRFPTVKRRDEGNFSWMLEKALGDALTEGRWLKDDQAGMYSFTGITFEDELGPKRSLVTVTGIRLVPAA
jgi:hypothetical protein